MTGGHDASTEASNDAFDTSEPTGGTANANAWSLLYDDAPLKPTSCPDCGNVFATDSTSCPWCGRIVVASERAVAVSTAEALSSAAPGATTPVDEHHHDPHGAAASLKARADAVASYEARRERTAEATVGLKRWASLLLAAAVLLVIATGLTIRARNSRTTSASTTTAAVTSGSPSTTATATTAATTSAPATTTSAAATVTTQPTSSQPTSSQPTSSSAPTTTAGSTPTTSPTPTTAAARFGPEQQQAIDLVTSLSTALTTKNWSRVRELFSGAANVNDSQLEGVYGSLSRTDVVPAKVDKLSESTYEVYAGVVQVKGTGGDAASAVSCNKYRVDVLAKSLSDIKSQPLRTQAGTVDTKSIAAELESACVNPTFG